MALPPGVSEVSRVAAPGGGYYILGSDGGIFTEGAAPFYGSMWSYKPGEDTLAGQHKYDANSLQLLPDGGYTVRDTEGRTYRFGAAEARGFGLNVPDKPQLPAKNVYENPAFLAFLRTSGLEMDTAAADVARQESALQQALASSVADLQTQGAQARRGIDQNFESRGVFRSGARGERLGEQEALTNTAIASRQAGTADQVAALRGSLANKVAEQGRRAGELGLSIDDTDYAKQQDSILKGISDRADTAYQASKRKLQDYGVAY